MLFVLVSVGTTRNCHRADRQSERAENGGQEDRAASPGPGRTDSLRRRGTAVGDSGRPRATASNFKRFS
jgi:hypothetical protein